MTTTLQDREEVLDAARKLVEAFGSHNTEAYFDCFDPDATFIFYTTPKRLGSKAEFRREWARLEDEDSFRVLSCTSTDPNLQLIGEVAIFTHSVQTTVEAGGQQSTINERETVAFRRDADGTWRAIHEHLSPTPA